jgi:uncharacterized protein GlcG (DUF336 family)
MFGLKFTKFDNELKETMRGIQLKQALKIIESALSLARQSSMPPLTLVILDNGGHVKASASEDGSGTARYQIAKGKAAAALGMGFGTRQFHNLIREGVLPEMFANTINGANNGEFIPLPGGVLIYDEQKIIGAMGGSGANSDQDEQIAVVSIKSQGLLASP